MNKNIENDPKRVEREDIVEKHAAPAAPATPRVEMPIDGHRPFVETPENKADPLARQRHSQAEADRILKEKQTRNV